MFRTSEKAKCVSSESSSHKRPCHWQLGAFNGNISFLWTSTPHEIQQYHLTAFGDFTIIVWNFIFCQIWKQITKIVVLLRSNKELRKKVCKMELKIRPLVLRHHLLQMWSKRNPFVIPGLSLYDSKKTIVIPVWSFLILQWLVPDLCVVQLKSLWYSSKWQGLLEHSPLVGTQSLKIVNLGACKSIMTSLWRPWYHLCSDDYRKLLKTVYIRAGAASSTFIWSCSNLAETFSTNTAFDWKCWIWINFISLVLMTSST